MRDERNEPEQKLRIASWLYACSEDNMKLSITMKVAEYEMPESKGVTVYQPISRSRLVTSKSMSDLERLRLTVVLGHGNLTNSSILSPSCLKI